MSDLAERAQALLRERSATVAAAESLTGGLIGAALTDVPGASAVFRGAVVSYATEVKADVLGVSAALLEDHGAVHPDVALAMAEGVRELLTATYGLSVTGVAGPEPQDGRAVGTVFVGVAGPGGLRQVTELRLSGDREAIRRDTVDQALLLLCSSVAQTTPK
ncbi:CinA family protein [Marinactinospora thermotolerans]|uniref:Competence/damage-inducible protein cinA n=1 Tax=Marinactinospora thermotolerans DSM 45154 TaxID=1122192 RepID=A0A1T4LIP8_9ACTN|nr:nicotinamide-nucleotide amidohydrolase family protein [Marinactinospora thermotolerans]SJZ54639.1 competence/damage-inducible protein cinA [Marinactinospora thermotolerans DSM 45154]